MAISIDSAQAVNQHSVTDIINQGKITIGNKSYRVQISDGNSQVTVSRQGLDSMTPLVRFFNAVSDFFSRGLSTTTRATQLQTSLNSMLARHNRCEALATQLTELRNSVSGARIKDESTGSGSNHHNGMSAINGKITEWEQSLQDKIDAISQNNKNLINERTLSDIEKELPFLENRSQQIKQLANIASRSAGMTKIKVNAVLGDDQAKALSQGGFITRFHKISKALDQAVAQFPNIPSAEIDTINQLAKNQKDVFNYLTLKTGDHEFMMDHYARFVNDSIIGDRASRHLDEHQNYIRSVMALDKSIRDPVADADTVHSAFSNVADAREKLHDRIETLALGKAAHKILSKVYNGADAYTQNIRDGQHGKALSTPNQFYDENTQHHINSVLMIAQRCQNEALDEDTRLQALETMDRADELIVQSNDKPRWLDRTANYPATCHTLESFTRQQDHQKFKEKLQLMREDVQKNRDIMQNNLRKMLERGEHLEKLDENTKTLLTNAAEFYKKSENLRQKMQYGFSGAAAKFLDRF